MKAEIITITGETNYGNRLQNYAVEQVLFKLGVDAVTYNACPIGLDALKFELKRIIKYIIKRGSYCRDSRFYGFNKFNRKYIHCVKNHQQDADYAVCGSDQIWNFKWDTIWEKRDLYFARFAPPEKRIAYSASISCDEIEPKYREDFIKGVSEMKCISVREQKGADLIYELAGRKVGVTVDPTIMLSRSEWMKIAKKPRCVNKKSKYILTYFLGGIDGIDSDIQSFIDRVAERYDLEIIDLYHEWTNVDKIKNIHHFRFSPDEFVWLAANCEIMFTDSFHGSIFSIIMDKPFRCFERVENIVGSMNSRMEQLFGEIGISDWCTGNTAENVENIFYKNYNNVSSVWSKDREKAYNYLKGALGLNEV